MTHTLAFDVYGTLIDPHGVVTALEAIVGERARALSATWRDKQLEYAFRRGLMRAYADFPTCTWQALRYACLVHGVSIDAAQEEGLLEAYRTLPAYADVVRGLADLRAAGHRLFAFSNGTREAVEGLLVHAGIDGEFEAVVSVDAIGAFKPDPAVYAYFLEVSGGAPDTSWLISSNPFDVLGAMHAGMKAAWLQREAGAVFDPWDVTPTLTVSGFADLGPALSRISAAPA